MNFKSEYIKNEINRLQQLLDNDNRFKQEFIKNKEKLSGLVINYNNVNLKDKICEQNIFKFLGFKKEGVRIKINDLVSGYIAFISNSQEEAEETKAYYIEQYNIKEYECKITKINENVTVELMFKEDLWGKVLYSENERKYYLYIYKTINKDDKNYYVRFDSVEFLAFALKITINDATMLLLNAINKERKYLIEEYEKICEYNLKDIEERISEYQTLRVFLLKDIDILKAFIDYVKENIYKLREEDRKLYIYCPNVTFGKIINKSGNIAGKYLNVLTALCLVEKKVDKEDNKNNRNAPAKYYIKEFTEEILKKSNEVARLFMLNNVKITDFTENKCKEILGEEKAKEIFFAKSNKKKGGKL
ncbi:hypothetical protein [Clostridium sp. ZBS2]|uniref:hypothetical protein n=1 Tax=Clostridium sp. ZBS2 TaxID=2949976 RepID=UPI00207A0ECE|nr:hypothetical protein [Clostridium sp. ZBS2]